MKLPEVHNSGHLPRSAGNSFGDVAQYGTAVVRKMTRTLMERDSSSSTCKPGDNSAVCQKPTDSTNTQTLPIVLGAVIPICCAVVVFIFLHRRNKKKQAIEDANDPHKSLDFGVDLGSKPANKRWKKGHTPVPQMTVTDLGSTSRPNKLPRGLSMDMMGSPYLLPGNLASSGESIHSMSRSVQDEHDPYRPVTFVRSSTDTSRPFKETGSIYSAATSGDATPNERENAALVSNAQRMSQSYPKRGQSSSPSEAEDLPLRQMHSAKTYNSAPSRKSSMASSDKNLPDITETSPRKQSLPPLPALDLGEISNFPAPPEPTETAAPPPRTSSASRPPRKSSIAASAQPANNRHMSYTSYYGEDNNSPPPPPPKLVEPQNDYDIDPSMIYTGGRFSIDNSAPSQQYQVQNNRLSTMGLRPLPQEDPAENAEQRANRIRSFYKEYFDDRRPHPQNGYYEEDWDAEYAHMYEAPQAPYAQPMGRRAMTPPPRGAAGPMPRFAGAGAHDRHYSTMSAGGRGRPAQRAPPAKKLPPPKALRSLPTPHLLKEDAGLIMNPIDFAPPTSFRELQNGRRPDSPMGIERPYSPSVKAYSPLVPAFTDLSAMPSPHMLRKSGTFGNLDFAAPRFRGQEGRDSDSGSIRSARSGISAVQLDAVRAGAYRVSRIPKEYVTSKDDLLLQLKPRMDLNSPA